VQRHRSLVDELKALGVPVFSQWVPTVEFTAGAGVLIGTLLRSPRLACLSSSSSP